MSSDSGNSRTHSDRTALVQEILSISDASQLVLKVQSNPKVILDAFQGLATGNASAVAELNETRMRLQALEQKQIPEPNKEASDESLLSRLVKILDNRNNIGNGSIMIPDPPLFEGAKKNFALWKDSVLMKLNVNGDRFPSEQSKLVYIYSRLDTLCQAHIHSWVKNGMLTFESVDSMMEILHTIFHDPNLVRDAVSRLYSNKQKNKPFSVWIAEIRRDAAIAEYDYDSRHLKDLIFHNLSLELQQAIIYEQNIDKLSLNEVVARLQDIENRQKAFANAITKSNRRMPINFQALQMTPNQAAEAGDPMDLSAAQLQPRSRLSIDEKNRRRNLGLCLYCGQPGHVLKTCPIRPSERAINSNRVDVVGDFVEKSGNA